MATVDEAAEHWAGIDATHCKNLFLRNQKGNRHYLVVLTASKKADLRAVADQIGDGKLSFASPERLMTHLGLTPGSVSPFGLINDREHAVRVVLDRDFQTADAPRVSPEHQHRDVHDRAPPTSRNSWTPAATPSSTSRSESAIRNPQSAMPVTCPVTPPP